jgi:GNAT superfamily N-acetyltransferase
MVESTASIIARSPKNCQSDELERFEELIKASGEVDPNGLGDRIRSAELLGFVYVDNVAVSVAGLKIPTPHHHQEVFATSGMLEDMHKFPYEYGWIYTEEKHRRKGLAYDLANILLTRHLQHGIYATARLSNSSVHGLLRKLGFAELGDPYPGRAERIQVFARSPSPGLTAVDTA